MSSKLPLLSVPAAFRAAVGYSPPTGTWRRWVLRKQLKVWKVGGSLRTTEAAVLEFVNHSPSKKENLADRLPDAVVRSIEALEKDGL